MFASSSIRFTRGQFSCVTGALDSGQISTSGLETSANSESSSTLAIRSSLLPDSQINRCGMLGCTTATRNGSLIFTITSNRKNPNVHTHTRTTQGAARSVIHDQGFAVALRIFRIANNTLTENQTIKNETP